MLHLKAFWSSLNRALCSRSLNYKAHSVHNLCALFVFLATKRRPKGYLGLIWPIEKAKITVIDIVSLFALTEEFSAAGRFKLWIWTEHVPSDIAHEQYYWYVIIKHFILVRVAVDPEPGWQWQLCMRLKYNLTGTPVHHGAPFTYIHTYTHSFTCNVRWEKTREPMQINSENM